jgi:paraquat-inducible protein A
MITKNILSVTVLACSMTCFVLGLSFPILSTKHQVLGIVLEYEEIKLFDSVRLFYDERDYFLAFVIFTFTIVFPVLKYIDLTVRFLVANIRYKKLSNILHQLDKWSMLDVFLVALLLLNFKINSSIIVMQLKTGTTFIALSVILRILSVHLIGNNVKTDIERH